MKKNNTDIPVLEIDRTVFKKSDEERTALKDLKRQHQENLKREHGDNWKKHFHKPVKL
jgi:hypothetical protein